jgi:FkbM family methyltransferase
MLTLKNLVGLVRPEYVFRPNQIGRRLWIELVEGRTNETKSLRLPWGLELNVDLSEGIGWSIYTRTLYETAVAETLWRLARPGDLVVDGGSNVGYMASLLAARVGKQGKLICFEPHPDVFAALQENARKWEATGKCGTISLHQAALSDRSGSATLLEPEGFSHNRGTSSLEAAGLGVKLEVKSIPLDELIADGENISVLKLDVQGHELAVLKGMRKILGERRVRHIVFEEERNYPAETHEFLRKYNYSIYGIEEHFVGIRFVPDRAPHGENNGTPNYLATLESAETIAHLQKGFWRCFGPARLLT